MVLGSDLRRRNSRRGRGTVVTAAALILVLGSALAACSDDSGGGSSAPPPTPSVEQTTSAPATAPADPAAATTQIKANWKKFFDPASSTKDKQAVLENGDKMGPVLKAFNGDKRGGQVQAEVTKVVFTKADKATVTYTLTLNGATALPDASGTSVEQGGTWKVSVNTLCALVALSGDASSSPGSVC
ncbi:hypothetical protein [Streptomyces sp. MBT62]|uniref:hypothetical protein n=1 Tax=Streptomyces sp. MBT62 TaxID=2800410 RepID=UPI00190BF81B|nr:hypothetical protein [Streptomyces sp. MBT62]MBK3570351.1 hypothetical protein [Streptomyces sp. MBT62]